MQETPWPNKLLPLRMYLGKDFHLELSCGLEEDPVNSINSYVDLSAGLCKKKSSTLSNADVAMISLVMSCLSFCKNHHDTCSVNGLKALLGDARMP